jgi:4-diphosphocytidyl-2-C-methyl-D-erythritol kinase
MRGSRWPAPAKLNLFLRITGRRDDGYHELQTIFLFLNQVDELEFRIRDDGVIRRLTHLAGVSESDDLVIRAARLLKAESGTGLGADITVHKSIPMAAGLGGGSSDAATTLVALSRLWKLGTSTAELQRLGLTLGADVPVFVRGEAAWAEGVGERLTPIELHELWYLVVCPECRVSTADVFSAPALTRNSPPMKIPNFCFEGSEEPPRYSPCDIMGRTGNDCEAVVRASHPEVGELLDYLSAHGPARMTGTGGGVFIPAMDEQHARRLASKLPRRWYGIVARGLNRSPLWSENRETSEIGFEAGSVTAGRPTHDQLSS